MIAYSLDELKRKLKEYEFRTFLVGVRNGEKKVVLRGKIVKFIKENFNAKPEYNDPEIVIIYDVHRDRYELQVNSLYIFGRYRKLVRGIPQTIWPCRKCRGRGCKYCNYKGKLYDTSVQELIQRVPLEATEGRDAKFHGLGREDIDARMLGNGRPFVLEIIEPKRRYIDLKEIEQKINEFARGKVEVFNLRFADSSTVRLIKSVKVDKTYLAIVKFDRDIREEELEKIKELEGKIIEQHTPRRVLHRRADKVRRRMIKEISSRLLNKNVVEFRITCESGTYVKELISGDEGRTKPSVAEILNAKPVKIELDVIRIHDLF